MTIGETKGCFGTETKVGPVHSEIIDVVEVPDRTAAIRSNMIGETVYAKEATNFDIGESWSEWTVFAFLRPTQFAS